MRPLTRRDFLAGSLSAGAAFTLARLAGGSIPTDLAARAAGVKPASLDLSGIKHVIFLMHENRSFDHYFGALQGVEGFFSGSSALNQNWPGGRDSMLQPYHLDSKSKGGECTDDLNHSWQAEHACVNNGAMDGFVSTHISYEGAEYGPLTMGYYTKKDIPLYYSLAQNFTICDHYHCSVLGPTHPNRLLQMTGTLDPTGAHGGPILTTGSDQALTFSCSWPTMPEILESAGVSWKVYNPYGLNYVPTTSTQSLSMTYCKNPLFYMSQYSDPTSTLYQKAFGYYGIPIPTSTTIYDGVTGYPPLGGIGGGGPNDFGTDVANNTLPAVSWIIPPDGYDEHPPAPSSLGEWYTAQVLSTLVSNPTVWASTVLFIMYDENDGWFDHVAPPLAPSGTPGEYVTGVHAPSYALGQPIGLGVRVPMLVVSPFSAGGWVCKDTFDHTSQLQFLQAVFNVDGTVDGNVSTWRQENVGDLTSALPTLTTPNTVVASSLTKLESKMTDNDTKPPVKFPTGCSGQNLGEVGPNANFDCATTNGSTVVTSPFDFKKLGVTKNQLVTGKGIPSGTTVTKVHPATSSAASSIVLSQAATATASGVVLIFPFAQLPIPDPQVAPTLVPSKIKPTLS